MTVPVRGGEGAFLLWLLFKIFGCLHFFLRTFIPCSIALYVWWVRGAGEGGWALTVGGADASLALFFPTLDERDRYSVSWSWPCILALYVAS